MKRSGGILGRLAASIAAMLVLSGCPLVSNQPLSDPGAAVIDRELLGSWEALDPDSGASRTYSFLPLDGHEILARPVGEGADPSADSFRFFSTQIDGVGFLNVHELGKGASGWYILRYEVDGDELVMALVEDSLFGDRDFGSPAELAELVRANLSNPLLYAAKAGEPGRDMIWRREGMVQSGP